MREFSYNEGFYKLAVIATAFIVAVTVLSSFLSSSVLVTTENMVRAAITINRGEPEPEPMAAPYVDEAYVGYVDSLKGNNSTFRENDSTINGDFNAIYGDNNTIKGNNNTIYGNNNTIEGDFNIINGENNIIGGNNNSFTPEAGNTANGDFNKEFTQ